MHQNTASDFPKTNEITNLTDKCYYNIPWQFKGEET